MGRGQRYGSQAWTSSQTGQAICYYCLQPRHMRQDCPKRQGPVVPQAELADQSSIQVTCMLSQECHLNLDASYSCLFLHLVSMFGA